MNEIIQYRTTVENKIKKLQIGKQQKIYIEIDKKATVQFIQMRQ